MSGSESCTDNDMIHGFVDQRMIAQSIVAAANKRGHVHGYKFFFTDVEKLSSVEDIDKLFLKT